MELGGAWVAQAPGGSPDALGAREPVEGGLLRGGGPVLRGRGGPCAGQQPVPSPRGLQVMESVVKNCGQTVHDEVANKQTMEELKELLKVGAPQGGVQRGRGVARCQAWAVPGVCWHLWQEQHQVWQRPRGECGWSLHQASLGP